MTKRVIITGGTGLLGKELVLRLLADNYEVITTTSKIEKISKPIHDKHSAVIKHVDFLNDFQIENFENYIKSAHEISVQNGCDAFPNELMRFRIEAKPIWEKIQKHCKNAVII